MVKRLILTLCVLYAITVGAYAQNANDLITEVANGAVTITGYKGTPKEMVIPAAIDGLPVTEIGEDAFKDCTSLTAVTIPSSVTEIGEYAFWGCSSLTAVTIPSSLTAIGRGTFMGCSSLTNVTIPSSVTTIENLAFLGCSSLTNVTIPSSVTEIGERVFENCTSLRAITVENRNNSFASTDGVLFDKDRQTIIKYPAGKKGASYTIPSSVTEIGEGAFEDCTSLTAITIPSSVTAIEESAFFGCSSLSAITVENRNNSFASTDGVLFDKDRQTIIKYPFGKKGTYTIPSSVTEIGGGAFGGCTSLTAVTIPSSVTEIGEYAFGGCTSLTAVTIPSSLTAIGRGAFAGCTSLTAVTIPSSVTTIENLAFWGCSSLMNVTIPSSVTKIGYSAFYECNLKQATRSEIIRRFGNYPFAEPEYGI